MWSAINCDLQDQHIDLGDAELLAARSWTWLRDRLFGLLSRPPVVFVTDYSEDGKTATRRPQPANRTQALLRQRNTA